MRQSLTQFPRKVLEWVQDVVWPEQALCLCCHKVLRRVDEVLQPGTPDPLLCIECLEALQKEASAEGLTTAGLFLETVFVFPYSGNARELVLALKHGTVSAAAKVLVPFLADRAKELRRLPPDTVITWVTMPPDRKRERCIDHGKLLAQGVADALGMECRPLLSRKSGGHTQQGLNAEARKQNVKGRFTVCDGPLPASVLLVDDVLTTGSTLEECAKVLRAAGVREVRGITVCKTKKGATV